MINSLMRAETLHKLGVPRSTRRSPNGPRLAVHFIHGPQDVDSLRHWQQCQDAKFQISEPARSTRIP